MLTKVARRGRLEAKLHDEQLKDGHVGQFAQILQLDLAAQMKATQPLSEQEVAKILAKADDLSRDDYLMLLRYQTQRDRCGVHVINYLTLQDLLFSHLVL